MMIINELNARVALSPKNLKRFFYDNVSSIFSFSAIANYANFINDQERQDEKKAFR